MARGGAPIVLRALEDEGIRLAFGIPGTHNIELYDALAGSAVVRPVLVTDEQSASFMADGAWRASGVMACVNVVPGPGLTHAISGIAEAYLDNVPMLVLGCGIRTDSGMSYQLHDVEQGAIAATVTKGTFRPERGEDIYADIRRACALAREAPAGPVFVEIPANHYLFRHDDAEWTPERSPRAPISRETLERIAAILGSARRVLIYAGFGAAGSDLLQLAERLEAPVATTFQGKGVFPESHPLALWPGYGMSAPPFARRIAATCDVTLAIGCRFGEVATGSYGAPPPGRLIHIDADPRVFGRNYPAEVAVPAVAADFVRDVLPLLSPRPRDENLRDAIRRGRREAFEEIRQPSSGGVSPGRLLAALQERLGRETIFTTDSGNGTFLAVEGLVLDRPSRLLAPVDYSCMGYAIPAAIGAKLAAPRTPVVALAGDGAFLMTGLELLTAASLEVPIMTFVLRDGKLAQIAQFQSVAFGRTSQSVLPDYDLLSICRGVGVEALRMESDDSIGTTLDRAMEIAGEGRPVAVEVAADYSRRTFFTRGVVRANFGRLPWPDRLRFLGRAVVRRAGW